MMTFNVKSVLTLFCIGLVIGFCSSFLFSGCNDTTAGQPAIAIISPEVIKKQAQSVEQQYQQKIAALEKRNRQLEKDFVTNQTALEQAKKTTAQREIKLKRLSEPKGFPAQQLLQTLTPPENTDSSLLPCDSLKQEIDAYLEENANKDKLYETQISTLDSVILVKDTIIQAQSNWQEELNSLLYQSISQQELIINENKSLRKQARRQKFRSTLKTIGLMILSGASAHYFINR